MVWLGSILVVGAVLCLLWATTAPRPANMAEDNLRKGVQALDARAARLERGAGDRIVTPALAFLGEQARKFTSRGMSTRIGRQLQLAGLAGKYTVEQVLALRLAALVVGIVLGILRFSSDTSASGLGQAVLIVAILYLFPSASLARKAGERQRQIKLSVPDILDQVTVSVEAGLGFDSALARAAKNGRGPFAEELGRVLQDVQIGRTRDQALDSLLARTDVDEIRKFVFAVRQAERYGLPVANVLRVQASDARERRRADAEERAQQIPVKIVFPLVFCILPALFVVVLGPAAINIFERF